MESLNRISRTGFEGSVAKACNSKQGRWRKWSEESGNCGRNNSHFTGKSSAELKCCNYDETEEHVATNRLKETKIMQ